MTQSVRSSKPVTFPAGVVATALPLMIVLSFGHSSAYAQDNSSVAAGQVVYSALIQPAAAGFNRLTLPPQALAASRRRDLSDVQIVNAAGQIVPAARLLAPSSTSVAARSSQSLASYPIFPRDSARTDTSVPRGPVGTTLTFEQRNGVQIVRLETAAQPGMSNTTAPISQLQPIGVLLDTRQFKNALGELNLDLDLPLGRAVALQLRASKDLAQWRTITTNASVFRLPASTTGAPQLEKTTIDLSAVMLQEEYLQITWDDEPATKSGAVTVKAATLNRSENTRVPIAPYEIALKIEPASTPTKAGLYQISVPFGVHVESIRITPNEVNTLVPFSLHPVDRPNSPLARSVAYRLLSSGAESFNSPLAVQVDLMSELVIEPDNPAIVFASAPSVVALVKPVDLAFLASAAGPFKLQVVANRAVKAAPTLLSLSTLIPSYNADDEISFKKAQVFDQQAVTTTRPAPVVEGQEEREAQSAKKMILWAVLLGAVVLLAGIAYSLTKNREGGGVQ